MTTYIYSSDSSLIGQYSRLVVLELNVQTSCKNYMASSTKVVK